MLDNTIMGRELTHARKSLVEQYTSEIPVDIGIGGGAFMDKMDCYGYDVGSEAIDYLMARDKFVDVYQQKVGVITCWDSLEHIIDPSLLINQVTGWIFVSMPVYLNKEDCLRSKHFKPGEHLWYWTTEGLIDWFGNLGFDCLEVNNVETDIGREGITSFVFKRVKDG